MSTRWNGPKVALIAGMAFRSRVELLLLIGAVALTRFCFRSRELYDLDSVNFALALGRFDPRVHQPHPPGYFLYIGLARVLNFLFHDANLSLVALSILASCGLVIIIYKMTCEWFGVEAARFAAILFLLSPLAWFHGTVALIYCVEAFFSALLGLLCWKIERGDAACILPTAVILGLAAGVRPSSLLLLGPLFLFTQRHASWKSRCGGALALVATVAAWFIPMLRASGGAAVYFGALRSLWQLVPSTGTVFNSSPATSIARACTIGLIYILCFGAASLVPLGRRYCESPADPRQKVFTLVWVAPGLCFFTFVFLKFINSGYLLLLAAPACIWLGGWCAAWYENAAWEKSWKRLLMTACAAANVLIFLYSPFYCSYRSVRRFESELDTLRQALPRLASPGQVLIIGFDSHFLGYRHVGYYLPDYLTVEYPEVELREGTRVFAMNGRDTSLLEHLPVASYSSFILISPPGAEAQQYLQKVTMKLSGRNLRRLHAGASDFILGPTSDLPLLFPKAAASGGNGVYAPLHSALPSVNSRAHLPARPGP